MAPWRSIQVQLEWQILILSLTTLLHWLYKYVNNSIAAHATVVHIRIKFAPEAASLSLISTCHWLAVVDRLIN